MSPEPLLRFFDNPIRQAQARRRLRRRQAIPTFVVIGLATSCAMLYGASGGEAEWRAVRDLLLVAILFLLCYRGTVQVSTTLADDRERGLLDFHRATPTSAWTDAFGYAAGCTARESLGSLLVAPFFLVASALAGGSLGGALLALHAVLSTALLCHAWGMFAGLSGRRRRAGQSTLALLVALTFLAFPLSSVEHLALGHVTPLPALRSLGYFTSTPGPPSPLSVFGIPCAHVTFTLLLQGTLTLFLLWCAARKLRAESAHAFSRPGALALFAALALFLIAPAWSGLAEPRVRAVAAVAFLAGGLLLASALAVSLVPTFLESLRAIRRARRFDARPGWLEPGASAWPLVPAFFLLLGAGTALLLRSDPSAGGPVTSYLASPEAGIAALACLAFLSLEVGAWECLQLRWRKASRSGLFLVAFVTLALPWILGSASAPLLGDSGVSHWLFATSPLYAVGVGLRALAARLHGAPLELAAGRLAWSLVVTVALAAAFWLVALRARARIEAEEAAAGDLPSIDAWRHAV